MSGWRPRHAGPDLVEALLGESGQPIRHLRLVGARRPTARFDLLGELLGLPDTMRLSANETLLTVGLRTMPAQLAVVDTRTFSYELVNLSPFGGMTTVAGHQWTSPSGRYTFAAFEGGVSPGVAVIDHRAGNDVVQTVSYPWRPYGIDHGLP